MYKLCFECYNCKLSPKVTSFDRLASCKAGKFKYLDLIDVPSLEHCVRSNLDIDFIKKRKKIDGKLIIKGNYINLGHDIPKPLLKAIHKYIIGPGMVYMPSENT
jgi:hypothetical protein